MSLFARGLSACVLLLALCVAPLAAAGEPAAAPSPSLLQFAAAAPATPDAAPVSAPSSQDPNPGMAATLALVPGIAVHGAGHFYAGRPLAGAALVAVELGSLYLAYLGSTQISSAVNSGVGDADSANFGDSEEFSRGLGLVVTGTALFLGSWLFDLSGAPTAAAETAAARKEAAGTALRPEVRPDQVALVLEQRF